MEFTAFDSRLGLSQGRVPGDGEEFLFVLGDLQPGYRHDLQPGDFAEVTQQTDLTDIDFVRAHLELAVPADLPSNLQWEVSMVVDGIKLARATCRPGRKRRISDLAANVSKMTGQHDVGVRLQLVEM